MTFEELDKPFKKLEIHETQINNEEIVEWFRKVRIARSSTADLHAIILDLKEILAKHDVDPYREKAPYYNFLLAYAYACETFEDIIAAIENIDSCVLGFKKLGKEKDWQQSISSWLWGLLLYEQGEPARAKKKIEAAIEIIEKLDREQYHFGQYIKEYQDLIEEIKASDAVFSKIEQKPKSVLDIIKGTIKSNTSKVQVRKENPPTPPRRSLPSGNHNPHLRHLIIPVDVRAIEELNTDSIPLEPEYFEKLKTYEEKTQHKTNILIPSSPIYGQAGASTNGEPLIDPLAEIEMADDVDETHIINFDGKDHKVEFLDKYITPKENGKHSGWLKIKGDSMNKAHPIPLNDGDYVMFHFSHNPNDCAGRIVVACLPDFDTQIPQLIVKRLVRLNDQSFTLRSESSLEKDPKTGISYLINIKVDKDRQITGEVIAVAKLI